MDLAKYTELSGVTVAEGDEARYNATIRRANGLLESALGYSLSPTKNLDKEELGKVQFQGLYPYFPISQETLLPADDDVEGSYRLFNYNDKDIYIKTDPARNVYHVKLVQARNDDEFVTIWDLKDFTSKNSRKFSKWIQKQTTWFNWNWYSWLIEQMGNGNGLMVAVDADWLTCNNMPTDLAYLWVDIVTYYADPDISVTGNIKSESVNGHSWTKSAAGGGKGFSKNGGGLRGGDLSPEQSEAGLATLTLYAGPNGYAATVNPAT